MSRLGDPIVYFYAISFTVLNWKPLFVLSFGKESVHDKISFWNAYMECSNYLYPVLSAALLTLGLPWIRLAITWLNHWAKNWISVVEYKLLEDEEERKLSLVNYRNQILDQKIIEENRKKELSDFGDSTINEGSETHTVGEEIEAGDFVYFRSDGLVACAIATSIENKALGYVKENASAGDKVRLYQHGINNYLKGLPMGKTMFLSSTQAGKITQKSPVDPKTIVQSLGIAKSPTTLAISIEVNPVTRISDLPWLP